MSAAEQDAAPRALMGVNRYLQEAQAKGDTNAAEYLRRLQQSKGPAQRLHITQQFQLSVSIAPLAKAVE